MACVCGFVHECNGRGNFWFRLGKPETLLRRYYIDTHYANQHTEMDITFSDIVNIATLLLGGTGLGAFFTWRFVRREAKAKAQAAEVNMAQQVQDTYQEMLEDKNKEVEDNHRLINELREDRDHYKQGYKDMRDALDKLGKEFREFRNQTEEERSLMKRDIARNGRQVECMRALLCGRSGCLQRVYVQISEDGNISEATKKRKKAAAHDPFPTPYGGVDESGQIIK